MEPFFRAWLKEVHHITEVELVPYDVTECFQHGRTQYSRLRENLLKHEEQHRPAEWFVTLTGGLPQMSTPLALLAAELLQPVTLLSASRPLRTEETTVHRSHLLSILKLAQITHLVGAYDYAAAMSAGGEFLRGEADDAPGSRRAELAEDMLALLKYGAARMSLQLAAGIRALGGKSQYASLGREGAALQAESSEQVSAPFGQSWTGNIHLRLLDHLYLLQTHFAQERYRDFLAQVHVFATWLMIARARGCTVERGDLRGVLKFNKRGKLLEESYELLDAYDDAEKRQCRWSLKTSPTSDFQSQLRGDRQEKVSFLRGSGSTPAPFAVCRLNEFLEDQDFLPNGSNSMEREAVALENLTAGSARNDAVHTLLELDPDDLQGILKGYAEPDITTGLPGSLAHLLAASYEKVFPPTGADRVERVPPSQWTGKGTLGSPYARVNQAWRKLVDEMIQEAGS
jgi:hypothetical protein